MEYNALLLTSAHEHLFLKKKKVQTAADDSEFLNSNDHICIPELLFFCLIH